MLSSVRAIARRALVGASVVALALSTLPALVAAQDDAEAAAAPISLDELTALNLQAWNERDADLVRELYAPDAVHTATFYDRTREHEGVEAIVRVALYGGIAPVAPRTDIPAADGEYRWAGFTSPAGGTACLWRAVDGQITRQDCVLPENSTDSRPRAGAAEVSHAVEIDEIMERLGQAWSGRDIALLEAVYAPDAVHSARSRSTTRRYEGPEEIARVTRGSAPEQIGPLVEFEAPEGELAWAQVSDVMGGTVCLYRARDGMIARHDCVLPVAG